MFCGLSEQKAQPLKRNGLVEACRGWMSRLCTVASSRVQLDSCPMHHPGASVAKTAAEIVLAIHLPPFFRGEVGELLVVLTRVGVVRFEYVENLLG